MKKQILFLVSLVFIFTNLAAAQNRTVTNADLEKHRQKRLEAQRDYRENYEKLGFPSPEELERQIEQSRVERTELAARLRAENLEKERIALEAQIADNEARSNNFQYQTENFSRQENDYFSGFEPYGFYNYQNFGFGNNRFNRRNYRNNYRRNYGNQPRVMYRNNLPVLVSPPPRPIFAPGTTNRGGRRN